MLRLPPVILPSLATSVSSPFLNPLGSILPLWGEIIEITPDVPTLRQRSLNVLSLILNYAYPRKVKTAMLMI